MKRILVCTLGLLCIARFAYSAPSNSISIPNSFTAGTTIESAPVNENFNEGQTKFNAHTHTDITSLGTVTTGIWSGTAIDEQYGGLGGDFSNKTKGSLLQFNATGTISSFTPGTSGQYLQTLGVGTEPKWNTLSVNLAADVSGTLPVLNGGTGIAVKSVRYVTYTGDGNDNRTVAHGLGVTPTMILIQNATDTGISCILWMANMGAGKSVVVDGSSQATDQIKSAGDTNVILGTGQGVNASGKTYCMIVMGTQ